MTALIKYLLIFALVVLVDKHSPAQDIFDEDVLDVRIEFANPDWRDILLAAKSTGDNRRITARVKINNKVYPDVQVRFKGNSSFHGAVKAGFKKVPFNLKASDTYPFAGGYETLKLANNYRDPSAVREELAYRIAEDYVPVPKSTYAALYVNNEYLGLYTATEGVSSDMANRHFCGNKKGLVQGEPDFDRATPPGCSKGSYASLEYLGDDPRCYEKLYEVKDSAEWQHLIRLARILSDSSESIEEVLDVHLALWMHALNNVMVNLDSYLGFFSHNYYLFRDSAGVYHPLIWDLNLAFGGFNVLKEGVDVDFATLSPIVHERHELKNRPLITELLKHRIYRRLYFSMMRTILDQWFVNGRYYETSLQLQDRIRPFVSLEKGTFYSMTDFEKNLLINVKTSGRTIPGIGALMATRLDYLNEHRLLKPTTLSVTRWSASESTDATLIKVHTGGGVNSVRLWYSNNTCNSYKALSMSRVSLTDDFECRIPGNVTSFYFELDGQESANLWPLNAPKEVISQ